VKVFLEPQKLCIGDVDAIKEGGEIEASQDGHQPDVAFPGDSSR
jgi:hypothetical protein